MILGLDFLAVYHGVINIKECTISLENNTFPLKLISDLKQHPNSYVQIQRTMCIQPNTIVIVPVQLENHLSGEYVVSPVRLNSELLGSHTLGRGNTTAKSFMNDSSTAVGPPVVPDVKAPNPQSVSRVSCSDTHSTPTRKYHCPIRSRQLDIHKNSNGKAWRL